MELVKIFAGEPVRYFWDFAKTAEILSANDLESIQRGLNIWSAWTLLEASILSKQLNLNLASVIHKHAMTASDFIKAGHSMKMRGGAPISLVHQDIEQQNMTL